MVKHAHSQFLSFDQAIQMRRQAGNLLDRLIVDRDLSEQRHAESGKRDPLKSVTGRSAMDNAITATRDLVGRLDELIAQMSDGVPQIQVAARIAPRTANRNTSRSHVRQTPAVLVP
jgi:hypothetical protein